jgi:hypothetical protein
MPKCRLPRIAKGAERCKQRAGAASWNHPRLAATCSVPGSTQRNLLGQAAAVRLRRPIAIDGKEAHFAQLQRLAWPTHDPAACCPRSFLALAPVTSGRLGQSQRSIASGSLPCKKKTAQVSVNCTEVQLKRPRRESCGRVSALQFK